MTPDPVSAFQRPDEGRAMERGRERRRDRLKEGGVHLGAMVVAVGRNTLGLEINTTVSLFLSKPRTGRVHTQPLAQDDQNNKQTETRYSIGRATRKGPRFPTLLKPPKNAPLPANRSCISLCFLRDEMLEGGGGRVFGDGTIYDCRIAL